MDDKTIKLESLNGQSAAGNGGDAVSYDKTIIGNMPNLEPLRDATQRPDAGTALPAADVRTLRSDDSLVSSAPSKDDNGFLLKGVHYEMVKCLSDSSGEAQVFLVRREGHEYVLKVYYPNFSVNRNLMQLIKSFHFEMIVHLIDYGKTYVDAKSRYYELMEYLRGGTLQEYRLGGDFKKFRHLALQGAAALAYCHKHNLLHKDIKPSNFFFRDEEHTQLVLGDFGISLLLEQDGKAYRTTQARTPIYAAPEMYSDVIDGEVEITPAVDYYSLGISLFALWLGENPMNANERTMMRQKNEGRLPRLNELPQAVRNIVMGLTSVNPLRRWTYDEVERWFLGEEVPVDMSSPVLRYKTFVVDPDRNLVAENVHELIPLLLDNERLAVSYLYEGRITDWLESCGNMKLSTAVKDIIQNRYPVDKKAGLLASVYTMEPTYPYRDVKGLACDDVHSISLSLLESVERYAILLQNPNDALFVWLEVHTKNNIDRLRSYFKMGANPRVAILRLVYEIDDEIPFMSNHSSNSVSDIVHAFGYANPDDDNWHSLVDGRLLSWMYSHEGLVACESLRILTEGQPYSKSLAYKVLYNLDREAAYDLRSAKTPDAVGRIIVQELVENEHASEADFIENMKEVTDPDGRFFYFAQMHGWYQELAEARRCFDLKSEENRKRLGAYDLRTALYRFCRILGAVPVYRLPDGAELSDGKMLPKRSAALVNEIRHGAFAQWLSVFYHEDPTRDFAEEYSYEHELVAWLTALGHCDEQFKYYKRYTKACDETRERVEYVRSQWERANGKERFWRYAFYGLTALWVLLVLVLGIPGKDTLLEHPLISIMLPVGGVSAVLMITRAYFKGYGVTISTLWGLMGLLSSLIPIYALRFVAGWMPGFFVPAVLLLTALYAAVCHLTDFRQDRNTDASAIHELLKVNDQQTQLIEPLYYTFKTKSARYNSTKFSVLNDIDNQVHSLSGESVIHYVLWCVMVVLVIGELIIKYKMS